MSGFRDTYARYQMDHADDDDLEAHADDVATERLEAALAREDRASVNYPRGWCPGGGL